MRIHTIKLKAGLFLVWLSLSACTMNSNSNSTQPVENCVVGETCAVVGIFNIKETSYGAVGILREGQNCISVAIPRKVIDDRKRWEGKKVFVEGSVYEELAGIDIISYEVLGRNVLKGYCLSGKVIYLDTIK